jgi:tetrahydromethanopterin S-methyltransferase subunit G
MAETTDIEKKSLEAHVELCAERYRNIDSRLDELSKDVSKVNTTVSEVHTILHQMTEKRNNQLINWGIGIIGTLTAAVAYLLINYVLK